MAPGLMRLVLQRRLASVPEEQSTDGNMNATRRELTKLTDQTQLTMLTALTEGCHDGHEDIKHVFTSEAASWRLIVVFQTFLSMFLMRNPEVLSGVLLWKLKAETNSSGLDVSSKC